MFSSISWNDFLEYLLLVTLSYFVLITYLYYREDFHRFLFRLQTRETVMPPVVETPDLLPMVHELVSELGLQILKASETEMPQPELFFGLQQLIKNYPALFHSDLSRKSIYISPKNWQRAACRYSVKKTLQGCGQNRKVKAQRLKLHLLCRRSKCV